MGKSKRSRPGHRNDPVAKQVKPPSDPQLAALRETRILPIIKDLQSADAKSRSSAASVISSIIQDSKCRKLLLREQIVHTLLTQTLTDAALESRAAGWGILQVLAQEEEADFCLHLFRQDILTAIEYASRLVIERALSDAVFAKLPKAEKAFLTSIAASLVSLLTALAEAGDDILEAIANNTTITALLFTLVARAAQEEQDDLSPLRSDAMTCLLVLSEENPQLALELTSPKDLTPCYKALASLIDQGGGEGIVACAILHNVYAALHGSSGAARTDIADAVDLIPRLVKAIATFIPGQPASNGAGGWSTPDEYQQLALEVLASIGTSLAVELGGPAQSLPRTKSAGAAADNKGEEDEDMDDQGSGDEDVGDDDDDDAESQDEEDDEMNEDEIEADMDMVTSGDHFVDNIDDLPTLKALLQTAVPELARIASVQASDETSLRLQTHALSALSNIAWSVSLVDFTEEVNAGVQKAWTPVARSLWQHVISPILALDTADVSLATTITSLAWALSRTLGGETPLRPDEHTKFISLYHATKGCSSTQAPDDPFQALGVRCVGVLGQLALHPAPTSLNRDIGTFLVAVLDALPETPTADAVEALNQLFDVYGNEEYPYDAPVFWAQDFLRHLEAVVPKARSMAKSVNKSQQPELRARADEVVTNLIRFLAYKKKHAPLSLAVRERT